MKAFFREWGSTAENVEKATTILNKLRPDDRDLLSGIFFDTLQNYHEYICIDQRQNCCVAIDRKLPFQSLEKVILDAPQPDYKIPE